ncbi:MAG: GAF domain-containing protein [Candidatus Heimdallarchaeaceae archaeon]
MFLLQINQFITSFVDVKINEQLYSKILKIAKKICDFKRISILLMDYQVNGLRVVESSGYEENIIGMIIDTDAKSIVARAARTRQTQNIQNVQKDKDYIMVDPSVLSELAVPVISPVNDKTVGVINIESEMEKAFNQEDVILFEMLAEKIALVLAIEETETKYLSLLNVLSFIAETEELNYKEIIGRIGEFLKKALGIKCAALFMTEEENKKILRMEAITGYEKIPEKLKKVNLEDEKGVVAKCAREKKALNIGNVKEIDYYLGINEKIKSEIAIPIIHKGELLGVLNAKSERENAFSKTEEKLFFIIGELISFAKLITDLREKNKKNRNEEKV